MAAIKVKLVRGLAGCPSDQRLTVVGMGLKKTNSEKLLPDTPATMGMIHKVSHLVEWERVDAPAPQGRRARKTAAAKA
jgi:large subunit ribosomal protein L30